MCPIALLHVIIVTEQSPRAFGRTSTQPYGCYEVQSKELQIKYSADPPKGHAISYAHLR